MDRSILKDICENASRKLILITGPRQTGKTTLARSISSSIEYLNYDVRSDRAKILRETWDQSKEYLVLDEIHKIKKWKLWLKGIYDSRRTQKILVTGSARLETFRKVGDSMAGRYFQYHLFPFDLKELKENNFGTTDSNFQRLMLTSGFPEPFLSGSKVFYNKWRRSHFDVIIRQDIIETESIKRISDLDTLHELLLEKIGSSFSYSSLREDLMTDEKTIKRWMLALENAYVVFKVTPYFASIKDSIRKSPKFYLYDFPRVEKAGAKLENFVALSLLKELHFRNDVLGENYSLHYLKNKRQTEIDFLVCNNRRPLLMIEVKTADTSPSPSFRTFEGSLRKMSPQLKKVQLVQDLDRSFMSREGVAMEPLARWLETMPF